jgi:hypothetical protein
MSERITLTATSVELSNITFVGILALIIITSAFVTYWYFKAPKRPFVDSKGRQFSVVGSSARVKHNTITQRHNASRFHVQDAKVIDNIIYQ